MMFGKDLVGADWATSAEIVRRYAEAGGNFIDTANIYANGESERIVGELVRDRRDAWVVATKYTCSTDASDPNAGGMHRKNLLRAVDESLVRLGTDYIDVLWVHMWDRFTPVEELVRALHDVVATGRVLYVGISDAPAWVVAHSVVLADLRGWHRFIGLQVPYSLVRRDAERDLLPMARAMELGVLAWAPLGGGLLTGRFGSDRHPAEATRLTSAGPQALQSVLTSRNLAIADTLNGMAERRGDQASQIALAWVMQRETGQGVIPILGTRTLAQLDAGLGALAVQLTVEEIEELDDVSAIELGFPHDFAAAHLAYGGTVERVIAPGSGAGGRPVSQRL